MIDADYWDQAVREAKDKGRSPRDVAMPPGILFFENLYLWERAVMEPISGQRQGTPIDWFCQTFVGRKVDKALSISCGTGFWERRMTLMGFASQIDAFDISPACLEWARELALREGFNNINYWRADANNIKLKPESYDFVVSVAALHHIYNLEHLMEEVNKSLKPGGLFFYDEYIGPNRLRWTPQVLEIVNNILQLIPESYRESLPNGKIKKKEYPLPVEEMVKRDPTEAVRSEDILPLTENIFEILEKKEYGGAILMPLFMNIVGNFDTSRQEDRLIVDFCISLEKILLRHEIVPANGVVVVARKKDKTESPRTHRKEEPEREKEAGKEEPGSLKNQAEIKKLNERILEMGRRKAREIKELTDSVHRLSWQKEKEVKKLTGIIDEKQERLDSEINKLTGIINEKSEEIVKHKGWADRLQAELEGIKSTLAYRLYKNTFGRLRK